MCHLHFSRNLYYNSVKNKKYVIKYSLITLIVNFYCFFGNGIRLVEKFWVRPNKNNKGYH